MDNLTSSAQRERSGQCGFVMLLSDAARGRASDIAGAQLNNKLRRNITLIHTQHLGGICSPAMGIFVATVASSVASLTRLLLPAASASQPASSDGLVSLARARLIVACDTPACRDS